MRPSRLQWKAGLTLVETIFSTLFISMTVLAIVNLFPGAYLSVRKSETNLQSEFVADSILEELRATPFSELVGSGLYTRTGAPFETSVIDGISYSPSVYLYDVPDTDPNILRGVRVEVVYRLGTTSRTVTYETYLHSLTR